MYYYYVIKLHTSLDSSRFSG